MPDRRTLADLGHETIALFGRACDQEPKTNDAADERLTAAIVSEAERFELWAVNLGLFVSSHGSLDYRLREAHSLRDTIGRFMSELLSALTESEESFCTPKVSIWV
jgi:hypothetical protein